MCSHLAGIEEGLDHISRYRILTSSGAGWGQKENGTGSRMRKSQELVTTFRIQDYSNSLYFLPHPVIYAFVHKPIFPLSLLLSI